MAATRSAHGFVPHARAAPTCPRCAPSLRCPPAPRRKCLLRAAAVGGEDGVGFRKVVVWRRGREYIVNEADLDTVPESEAGLDDANGGAGAAAASVEQPALWDMLAANAQQRGPVDEVYDDGGEAASSVEDVYRETTGLPRKLQIQKADFTVNSIIDKINRGKINLRPSYQREYVWTTRTASRLVESLLLNVPIPTMFFHETETGMEVVDGKQRLTSIWSFIQGSFPDGTVFKLTGLEVFSELNGKRFTDLTDEQQEIVLDFPLNVHTIAAQSQPHFVFEVFERLNMGATQLNEQELRNCIYLGPYTALLSECVTNADMLHVCRSDSPHLRMRDRELVLRFFAMVRTTPDGFYLPAKAWLNDEMRTHRNIGKREYNRLKKLFESTIETARAVFGEHAFRPVRRSTQGLEGNERFESGEINVALWDTVMFSLAGADQRKVRRRAEEVREAFVSLCADEKFRRLLVTQPKAIVARSEAWQRVLNRALE